MRLNLGLFGWFLEMVIVWENFGEKVDLERLWGRPVKLGASFVVGGVDHCVLGEILFRCKSTTRACE